MQVFRNASDIDKKCPWPEVTFHRNELSGSSYQHLGLVPSSHLPNGHAKWCHWLSDKVFISIYCHCHHYPALGLIIVGQEWYSNSHWPSPCHTDSLMYIPDPLQISDSHMVWRCIQHLFRVWRSSDQYPCCRKYWVTQCPVFVAAQCQGGMFGFEFHISDILAHRFLS